jgi:hypothetical protein
MRTSNPNDSCIKKPTYFDHNGFLMPLGFPAHNFSDALTYKPDENDLIIATYPKCGTTLTQHMVYIMLNNGVPIQPHEKLDQMFPHLEEVGSLYIANSATVKGGKRLIKTHLPYNMTPLSPCAKYIYVARNPKDCVVSFYHHTRGFPQHYGFGDGDFEVYFELFLKGEVDFGDYFKTLRSWLDRKDDANVLFITYEDIRIDKKEVLTTIAEFIGGGMKEKLIDDNEALMEKILFHSSLEEMKKEPLRWCSERKVEYTPFIRSGQVGGYSELLTKEQGEKLDDMMKSYFSQKELNFLGKQYF